MFPRIPLELKFILFEGSIIALSIGALCRAGDRGCWTEPASEGASCMFFSG
jgi:hypothetical protein